MKPDSPLPVLLSAGLLVLVVLTSGTDVSAQQSAPRSRNTVPVTPPVYYTPYGKPYRSRTPDERILERETKPGLLDRMQATLKGMAPRKLTPEEVAAYQQRSQPRRSSAPRHQQQLASAPRLTIRQVAEETPVSSPPQRQYRGLFAPRQPEAQPVPQGYHNSYQPPHRVSGVPNLQPIPDSYPTQPTPASPTETIPRLIIGEPANSLEPVPEPVLNTPVVLEPVADSSLKTVDPISVEIHRVPNHPGGAKLYPVARRKTGTPLLLSPATLRRTADGTNATLITQSTTTEDGPVGMKSVREINPFENVEEFAQLKDEPNPSEPLSTEAYVPRAMEYKRYEWEASNVFHNPLYFADDRLERYGHSYPDFIQPFVSVRRFSTQLVMLPYQMFLDPPKSKQYPLGHYRPGDHAPKLHTSYPLNTPGALFQAGVTTGLFFLIP